MHSSELENLFEQYLAETISDDDLKRFWESLLLPEHEDQWNVFVDRLCNQENLHGLSEPADLEKALSKFKSALGDKHRVIHPPHPARIRFLHYPWLRYAAAILLVVATAVLFWPNASKKQHLQAKRMEPVPVVIVPGGNKAVLTLSDGSTVMLDQSQNGTIAKQGNSSIIKLANGQVAYNVKAAPGGKLLMNTMATPRGGQYELRLADGSKVWLNAASSITYPTDFTKADRTVTISGEVYFEVAKDKSKPFKVKSNKIEVEVLGTHFNINSYSNEESIKTTLVEGSVRVSTQEQQPGKTASRAVILKPGQQAQVYEDQETVKVVSASNIGQITAWKDGFFNFNNADFQTVMRQLERWYDIRIEYEGAVPSLKFRGELDRGVKLSEVLEIFTAMDIKYHLNGRTLFLK